MAGFLSDVQMDAVLDSLWGSGVPSTWYVALMTLAPDTEGNGGTEAAWSGYARVAVTNDPTEWPAAAAGVKVNANELDYGTAGSGPTDLVGFAFVDDPTAPIDTGNFYAYVELTGAPVSVVNGAPVKFPAGNIDLTRCA